MIDYGPVDDALREYRRCPCDHHRETFCRAVTAELVRHEVLDNYPDREAAK